MSPTSQIIQEALELLQRSPRRRDELRRNIDKERIAYGRWLMDGV